MFKEITKELKLIKQIPKGESVFMRTSPTGTYAPSDILLSVLPINFWLIDANTPVLSPSLTANVSNLKPNILKNESEPEAAAEIVDEHLSTATTLVTINPF
jgi:hypothetical protein